MGWFNFGHKKEDKEEVAKIANLKVEIAKGPMHQATEQALADAERIKELFDRNHFHVTLFIAAGGDVKKKDKGKNG